MTRNPKRQSKQVVQSKTTISSGRPSVVYYLVALVLAGLAAYYSSFAGQFIIDDKLSIVQNESIRRLWPLGGFFTSSRPFVDYSLAINYALGGFVPWSYHAFNLVIHIIAGLTLFGLIRRTPLPAIQPTNQNALAFCCALLWLVHPLQTQAVTYVIQRSESMMGMFYLLTLYSLLRGSTSSPSWAWYLAGIAACILGMGCKAVMLTAPIVALLYDRVFLSHSFADAIRKRWPFYLGLAGSWLALGLFGTVQGVFAHHAADPITVGFGYSAISPWQYLRTQPEIILHYLRLAMLPIGQCVDYGWAVQTNPLMWALKGLAILALLIGSLWALVLRRPIGFLGFAFFLILAPTSSFIPIRDLAFEHRMYLPLACVMIAIVFACHWGLNRIQGMQSSRIMMMVIGVIAAIVYAAATIQRNTLYADPIALWLDTIKRADPYHPRPHNALGSAMLNARRPDDAIQELNKALLIDPYYAGAYANLGSALLFKGQYSAAVEQYHKALSISPYEFDEEIHFLLGSALLELQQFPEARNELDVAAQMRPERADVWCNLGNAWRGLKNYEEAEKAIRKAISLKQDYAEAWANLGVVLTETQRREAAIDAFSQALSHSSTAVSPIALTLRCHLKLGDLYVASRQFREARTQYEVVLSMEPDNRAAQQSLSSIRSP
jgi:tetratricopeptide (TPR) repeat protein